MNPATANWANFFAAEVGAAAALTGLVVVAVSINLARILSFRQLPARAAESLVILMGALMLASFGLMPDQPVTLYGAEVLAIGVLNLIVALYNQWQLIVPIEGFTAGKRIMGRLVNVAVVAPLIIGGTLLLTGGSAGLYWAALGILISLAAGVWTAWILLVEIMR